MRRNGIHVPERVDEIMVEEETKAQTVVLCAINGKFSLIADGLQITLQILTLA